MVTDFATLIHDVILESPMAAKDLAVAIGKPYSTLLREVNPYDSGAKLGAETLLQIMEQTHNTKPLQFMADRLGFELVPSRKASPQAPGAVPVVNPGAFQGRTDIPSHMGHSHGGSGHPAH